MPGLFDFSVFPVLNAERLVLRRLIHADADAMVAIFGAPEVLRFLNLKPVVSPEKAVELIDWFEQGFANQDVIQWGITRRGEDTVIGTCGFYNWQRDNRSVDVGYHIVPAEWGRGYATEAARALLAWCFENLNLHRIQADCTEGNDASERVMVKCGFTLEGVWRESSFEHGRFVNIRQYGLLRREFSPASGDGPRAAGH